MIFWHDKSGENLTGNEKHCLVGSSLLATWDIRKVGILFEISAVELAC